MDLETLRNRISRLQSELDEAYALLDELESQNLRHEVARAAESLQLSEYRRYGRQMILDGFGLPCTLHAIHGAPQLLR